MRRRSGGFHCDSIEQFIEAYETSLSNAPPHRDRFSDIDAYLRDHQHFDNSQTDSHQEYFFSQIDQMLAEEEDELSLGSRNRSIVCNNVGLICSQLPLAYDYLINLAHIEDTYTSLYQDSLAQGQEIAVDVMNHVVNVRAKPIKQTDQFSPEEGEKSRDSVAADKKQRMQEETLKQKSVRERVRRSEIQLIVYYNRVQTQNQRRDKQTNRLSRQAQEGDVQTKFWLIRQREDYSPLLRAYMNQCQHIFRAQIKDDRLQVSKFDQTAALKRQNLVSGNQVRLNLKTQSWDSVLARISVSQCSRC